MKHTIEIKHRYTGAVLWTGEVEAPKDTPQSCLLGLAVLAALKAKADLTGANLIDAKLRRANLTGAKLRRANLIDADLIGANLIDAKLRGANLTGAKLRGANLIGADLTGANLTGADLTGANLTGANLIDAKLRGANFGGLKLIARASRADYEFIMWSSVLGGHIIRAGCRTFTLIEFRAYVAAQYPGTDKAEETLSILDYLESRLNAFNAKAEGRS
jgi:uncharacterized protein YjbI with pentapeptide repeats